MPIEFTRRAFFCGALTSAAIAANSALALRSKRLKFAGVNLAGAEFGIVPGAHEVDYSYPTPALLDYYSRLGFNLVRLPFKWERLQPTLDAQFSAVELARLCTVVDYAAHKGLHTVLDTHNFARRRLAEDNWATEYIIGSELVPSAAFSDYCARLAQIFRSEPSVIIGLMNEPWGLSAEHWLAIVNEAIGAIRSEGANQLILVPGIAYSGAHCWIAEGNEVMGQVIDPANNFAFEVHQYFDDDSSGTSPTAVSARIGSERIEGFQRWARDSGVRAFLGEFGSGNNELALTALDDLCQALEANPDVWLGWAGWAGGGSWPDDYILRLDPLRNEQIRPQTKVLSHYARQVAG